MDTVANKISPQFSSPQALSAFRNLLIRHGKQSFNYSELDPVIQQLYFRPQAAGYQLLRAFCRRIGQPEQLQNCVIEYTAESYFQAWVIQKQNNHFIGVSAALPALLFALMNMVLFPKKSNTALWSKKANSTNESRLFPDQLLTTQLNPKELVTQINALITETIPARRWQRDMSLHLTELAIVFCIAHEIGHLVRGHDKLSTKRGLKGLTEIRSLLPTKARHRNVRQIGKWVSQAWEIQADKTAIALLHAYVINSIDNQKAFMKALRVQTISDLYKKLLEAIYYVFLLLGQQQYTVDSLGTHPTAIVRITYIAAFVGTVLTTIEGLEATTGGDLSIEAMEAATQGWEKLGFSSGKYSEEQIKSLIDTLNDLNRAVDLAEHFFRKDQWAVFIK